ncbi:MAG: hypothetical protein Q7W51_08850 [Coriobacteriia bacterium]|nr:hypothetical protein [Coriobacteriia bacterium]
MLLNRVAEISEQLPYERLQATNHLLDALKSGMQEAQALTLEEEFTAILESFSEKSRNIQVTVHRYGLDGTPPEGLETVGQRFGVTRERVRQIVYRFESSLERLETWNRTQHFAVYAPVLDSAIALVRDRKLTRLEAPVALAQEGVTLNPFSIDSLEKASALLGRSCGFGEETALELPVAVHRISAYLTTRRGALTVEELGRALEAELGMQLGEASLRRFVDADPEASWLDADWYWIPSAGRNRVLNRMRKAVSTAEIVSFHDLRNAVRRDRRMANYAPPSSVLKALCMTQEWVEVDGDHARPRGIRPAECMEGAELGIALTLLEFGPAMRAQDIRAVVESETDCSGQRFHQVLMNSACITRYARGVYGLRGREVSALELYELAVNPGTVRPDAVAQGFGQVDEGGFWLAYRLSAASLRRRDLPVPKRARGLLDGKYILDDILDGRPVEFTVDGRLVSGIGPALAQWGVEVGDWLLLVFETSEMKVAGFAGDRDLIAERVEDLRDGQGE